VASPSPFVENSSMSFSFGFLVVLNLGLTF
jgi:hypothetical protein